MSNKAGILVVAVFAAGGLAGSWATARTGRSPFGRAAAVPVLVSSVTGTALGNQVSFTDGFVPVVDKVLPAVVNIASSKIVRSPDQGPPSPFFSDPFFRQFFGDEFSRQFRVPREQREHSLGSGVIVNSSGYILTNNHVVEGASEIKVYLGEKREYKGRIIGTDRKTDVAVVKIDGKDLPVLTLGDSSKVRVGDFALAVGNPFGVGQTVTMGIVSATGRGGLGIEDYEDFVQTDAAINPGNSGGALVNVRGELIAINTAIISGGGGGNQGVGFAIPINMARSVMDQILKHGRVIRGSLGVVVQPVTQSIARAFNLPGEPRGALVADVTPNSAAAKSGIQRGDILLELNGEPIAGSRELSLKISMMAPGATVKLKLFRSGQEREVSATLGELQAKGEGGAGQAGAAGAGPHIGISVDQLTPDIARQLGLPARTSGVVITSVQPGSAAEEAGLRRGDVIQEVNRKPVATPDQFLSAVRQAGGGSVLLLIERGGDHVYVMVEPR